MKRSLLILYILVLCGCSPVSSVPAPTSLSDLSQTTTNTAITSEKPTIFTYPPCAPSPIDQLPTPPSPILNRPPQKLPEGLTIEEYRSYVNHIHTQNGGCKYAGRMFNERTINLNSSYQIVIQPIDINSELVKVLKAGFDIFDVKTLTYGSSGLMQAWSYDDHWVIEIKNDEGVDIIRDGESLKKINEYDKVFAFQLLDNKPFYFYRKNDVWGINYDNREIQLDYDEIPYTNISDGMDPTILQYQNMVLFQAKRNNENYSVVIGFFH